MKDWRGTEIKVGSRVIYVSRQHSSMWVTEGEVTDIIGQNVAVKRLRSSQNHRNSAKERIVYPAVDRITVID